MCHIPAITPEQVRIARGILGWPRIALALRLQCSETPIAAFELKGFCKQSFDPARAQAVFEEAGLEFSDDGRVILREAESEMAAPRR